MPAVVIFYFYGFCRRQIIYTEELTPKYLFNRTYLHLRTNVLPYNSKDVMEAIVGEASIKLGLEQPENVQDSRIPVTERWTNLKGVVESRQGLYVKYIIDLFYYLARLIEILVVL